MWLLLTAARAQPVPIAFRDGERVELAGPVRFGLVGGFAWADAATEADLRASELGFVVLAGDAVARGSRGAYAALCERLDGLPVVPLPGAGEARGDSGLRRFATTWEGLGVAGLDLPVPWRAFDVQSGDVAWRFLVLDAERDRPGSSFQDQLSWLPKVLADGDQPLIVLLNQPVRSLSASFAAAGGAGQLHELVRRHADAARIALVAAGGAPSPEFLLPGGPWGEGWLGIGRIHGPPDTLRRTHEGRALEPGFDKALARWFVPEGVDPRWPPEAYGADVLPVRGWWRVTLDGGELGATLRMCRESCSDVYTLRWTRADGWR